MRNATTGVIFLVTTMIFGMATAHGEKIRTAIPQANLNYLSIHVADARGFLKTELEAAQRRAK